MHPQLGVVPHPLHHEHRSVRLLDGEPRAADVLARDHLSLEGPDHARHLARLGLVAQATLRAGCERRVFECAWLEATMGFGALAAGAALAAVFEGLISPEVLLAAIP